jgi:hypothetical protein
MSKRNRFRPSGWDCLETRMALTHGGPISPRLIGTLSPNPGASGPAGRVVAQVNASFNQFTANYQQAQGAYLSSGTAADATAFKAFTTQAVGLLAQELTRSMVRLPGSLVYIKDAHQRSLHGSNTSVVLQAILYSRINGGAGSGSLLDTLNSAARDPSNRGVRDVVYPDGGQRDSIDPRGYDQLGEITDNQYFQQWLKVMNQTGRKWGQELQAWHLRVDSTR